MPSRKSRTQRRIARPLLESLEPRLVLSTTAGLGAVARVTPRAAVVGESLVVEGTPGPDFIRIAPTTSVGVVRVLVGGAEIGRFGPVKVIDIAAGAGDDIVVVDPRITLPARLDGGAGRDVLRGGSGPNALLGGDGDDTLFVAPGRDTFDGGPGRTRLIPLAKAGVIQVGASAAGAGLRRLSGSHQLAPLRFAGPAVVGAADLRHEAVVDLLRASYEGGHTVALAGATEADANALARLLGDPRPVDFPDAYDRADLVAFRKVTDGRRASFEVSLLLPVSGPVTNRAAAQGIRLGDRRYLGRVFTPTPKLATSPLGDDPQGDLTKLAAAYNNSASQTDPGVGQTQIYNTVYSARSFSNQEDFFYFSQEIQAVNMGGNLGQIGSGGRFARLNPTTPGLKTPPLIIQPTPQNNPQAISYTTGVNMNFGGTIGWNEDSGFNASIGGGVSLENSETITVPSISITYFPNLTVGEPNWIFESNIGSLNELTVTNSWIWQVPFSAYQTGQTTLPFLTYAVLSPADGPEDYQVEANGFAPLPFGDTFALADPVITGVSTPTVEPGGKFTITGSAFYPSLVESVLIGGQPLTSASYSVPNDSHIEVVVPNTPGNALPVVVRTSQGLSNANVTINIAGASQVSVQSQPVSAVAGQAFANTTVGIITDSDTNAGAAGFSATITWGDGTSSIGTVTAAGPGRFTVSGSHTYAAAGTFTFGIAVTDPDGSKGTANGEATVTAAPSGVSVRAQPVSAVAGQAFANVAVASAIDSGTNTDPSGFSATITWGDGTSSPGTVTATSTPGTFTVSGSHTYAAAGTYNFSVQVTDPQGAKGMASGTATVSPPSTGGGPQDLVTQPISAVAGRAFTNATIATFTDSDFGVTPSDFTAAIDWGDGIVTPITTVTAGSNGFIVLGTHTYVNAGTYTFRVQVIDGENRKVMNSGIATVTVN